MKIMCAVVLLGIASPALAQIVNPLQTTDFSIEPGGASSSTTFNYPPHMTNNYWKGFDEGVPGGQSGDLVATHGFAVPTPRVISGLWQIVGYDYWHVAFAPLGSNYDFLTFQLTSTRSFEFILSTVDTFGEWPGTPIVISPVSGGATITSPQKLPNGTISVVTTPNLSSVSAATGSMSAGTYKIEFSAFLASPSGRNVTPNTWSESFQLYVPAPSCLWLGLGVVPAMMRRRRAVCP